mmetsp:Transcript_9024/g.7948  ORF Transcript_9024/g.7948 Transcript_9024/m.7948 type:complete len:108 (-) Transcript_9024:1420-1743(-)
MAYSLLCDILEETFGLNMVEPRVNIFTIFKAKPRIFNPSNLSNYSTANHMKPIKRDLSPIKKALKIAEKRRVLEIEEKVDLSLPLKETIAAYSYRDRPRVNEVAQVV